MPGIDLSIRVGLEKKKRIRLIALWKTDVKNPHCTLPSYGSFVRILV